MTTLSTKTAPSLRLLSVLALVVLFAGCGGRGYDNLTVEGNVTIDGVAVPKGSLTFSPLDDSGPVVGTEIVDGKYACEGVPVGRHRVMIIAHAAEMDKFEEVATGAVHEVPRDILPAKYCQGMEITVSADTTRHDIIMESGGEPSP